MAKDPWYLERIEPMHVSLNHGQLREHVVRYRFAAEHLSGRLLDAGCGTGYGAQLLCQNPLVTEIVGLDRDERCLKHARRYFQAPSISFHQRDLLCDPLQALGLFDSITALEILEHVAEPEELLRRLNRLLKPGGKLLVSTPLGAGRHARTNQPFHFFQLRREELKAMLKPLFTFHLFGQKGESIEPWRRGERYFLLLALCRSRFEDNC